MNYCNKCDIVYEERHCPLCVANETIERLEETIEKLEKDIELLEIATLKEI